ncbi:hypothetical protein ACTXT7_014780 [Hymenolepis weldensis]
MPENCSFLWLAIAISRILALLKSNYLHSYYTTKMAVDKNRSSTQFIFLNTFHNGFGKLPDSSIIIIVDGTLEETTSYSSDHGPQIPTTLHYNNGIERRRI